MNTIEWQVATFRMDCIYISSSTLFSIINEP